ncbi:AraC family transcriptional regulator [Rhizobium sp. A37_96]
MPIEHVPLSRFAAVNTRSPEAAREAIGRIFCPHFLNPLERNPVSFHARHHTVEQADYSVNFVAYGSAVEIDPGELSRFFLLQLPIAGAATVRCGTQIADVGAGLRGSVLSPTLGSRMVWNEGCQKLIILIRREALEAQFESLTHQACRAIEFDAAVDLTIPVGAAIWQHAQLMLGAAETSHGIADAYKTTLRDGITTLLLTGLASNKTMLLSRPAPSADPVAVRRAQDFMEAHAERPIAMAEIAKASGGSLRSLQNAYRNAKGMTLSDGLQALRLTRFRSNLLACGGAGSVAEAAFAAGLGHLGRAAAAYRDCFGETPSETLRRRK